MSNFTHFIDVTFPRVGLGSERLSMVTENGRVNLDSMAGVMKGLICTKEEDLTARLRANQPEEVPKCACLQGGEKAGTNRQKMITHILCFVGKY